MTDNEGKQTLAKVKVDCVEGTKTVDSLTSRGLDDASRREIAVSKCQGFGVIEPLLTMRMLVTSRERFIHPYMGKCHSLTVACRCHGVQRRRYVVVSRFNICLEARMSNFPYLRKLGGCFVRSGIDSGVREDFSRR